LNQRQNRILELIEKKGKSRVGDIAHDISDVSIPTLMKDMRLLLDRNIITKDGIVKATTYFFSKKHY